MSKRRREQQQEEINRLRDHGRPQAGTPTGPPTWKKAVPMSGHDPICPNCGGWLCEVEVPVSAPMLRGGKGITRYLGCPACPFASMAVAVAIAAGGGDDQG